MAVTTRIPFPATSNSTTRDFSLSGLQLNNQDDIDVYVTKTTAGIAANNNKRILHFRQSSSSNVDANHKQVNNTDGLYFPAITHTGGTETLENYTLVNNNGTVRFNSALPQGAIVFVERRTRDADSAYTSFASGSTIRATDLNNSSTESNFTAQEARNKALEIEGAIFNGDLISPTYITSENIVDGTIQTADIGADQITGALIADDTINSEHYAAGSIDLEHMSANSVDSDQYVDGSIDLAHMSANSVDSDQYVDGSIDLIHMSANSIDSAQYVDGSIDREHLSNDIIDSTKLADNSINSEHYVDGSIDRVHLEADIIDSTKLADDAVGGEHIQDDAINSEHYAAGSIDHEHLANDIIDGGNIQDDVINSEHIAGGALDNEHYAAGSITSDKLSDATVVTSSEQAAATVNDTSFFTSSATDARYFRQDSSETISSGSTWTGSDAYVATTGAIDLRVIELVDNVGGFVPIPNETSFPATNPDINTANADKGGTIVSVSAASTALAPQSGTTLTIANGRGTGNAVIITGVTATIPSGFGFLVETTATDHTYAFHRLVPVATQVATVANNITNIVNAGANVADINNFADVYQISTSAPTARADSSSLQIGDLWFDSSSNKVLMIYDNSSGEGFTAATPNASDLVNINIVAGQITYQEDLGLITNAVSTGTGNNSVNTVAGSISNVNSVASSISNVNAVAGNATNINAVAADATDIGAVAGKATEIGRLGTADAVADMNTLGTTAIVSDMDTLADISSNITTVANNDSNVTAVAGNASNINAAVSNASNINAAVSNASNINTVAGISANVTTVAGISSDVTSVANNNSNVTAVAGNSSNINSAVSNASNINSAVSNASNINTVAGISSNVTTVATNNSNVTTVAGSIANVNTTAGSISNVNSVAGSIANVNTAASNLSSINSFANVYRIAGSDPGSNNDEGDLYFNTTSNELRVYNGSSWQGGVTATGNLAGLGANTFTGAQTFISGQTFDGRDVSADGAKLDAITTSSGVIVNGVTATTQSASDNSTKVATTAYTDTAISNLVDSSPSALNTLNELAAALNDDANFSTTVTNSIATKLPKAGGQMTGNITFSGSQTVDGRDLSADGAKLDGIQAGATVDQTASDIVALIAGQTIAPNVITTTNLTLDFGSIA